jgi:addiction module RelE/StbE family toxin
VIVYWSRQAEQDRLEIWNYIAADNPAAAARVDQLFSEAVARLVAYPEMGRAGEVPGTRELIPHPSYRLVYEIEQEALWILALVHTARQWPPVRE